MTSSLHWLPRQVKCCVLLVSVLISPNWAVAQSESAGPSSNPAGQADNGGKKATSFADLDIEQLAKVPIVVPSMDIPVTSVTKELSTVGRSAAAVYVITNEMIRRSGATCIPEALRLAPGVEVAQINSNTWAITCRGFNYAYSNKLLVLIDGRTVYNPDMSGVFWDVQDVLLEDVDRIEVIRGPGGTLWGANAVNGVINVITKRANDTQGVYLQAGGGSHARDMEAFRYGGAIGEDCHYRVYGKHSEYGPNHDPLGQFDDAWRQGRCGFRADWEPDRDKTNTLTIQGDHYVGTTNNSVIPTAANTSDRQTGENLLMRWRHVNDDDSDWSLQTYYDNYTNQNAATETSEIDKTVDVEFQYRFRLNERHSITCGAGYRHVDSYFPGPNQFSPYFPMAYYAMNYTNEFVQDNITLIDDRLNFILGCKLEQNPFTGLEYEPTARVLFTPDNKHTAWCAVSRAVHTPSRFERQISATLAPISIDPLIYPRVLGNGNIVSEEMIAYEIGYREQMTEKFSWDAALFYNTYGLLVFQTPQWPPVPEPTPWPHDILNLTTSNGQSGEGYGVELSGDYAVREWWRLHASYTYLNLHLRPTAFQVGIDDPPNQISLRSAWDVRENMEFDMTCRYVDRLSNIQVPSYISMDLRLAYRPKKNVEVAVVGQNLLQESHQEFNAYPLTMVTEVPRGVYSTLTWRR